MSFKFSHKTGWDTAEGSLARMLREAHAAGREVLDLTMSNPTRCGFVYDDAAILGALTHPASLIYDAEPRGILPAREAVAAYYADHHAAVSPDDMILTTSTSEAYTFLFRLLCDAGDAVLAAQPSYPLFDFLADLDDVQLIPYPLFYDFGWWIDFAELERRITLRTRAILLVHPNNPTGHATTPAEREHLQAVCVRYGLALIVDEVFLDYGLSGSVATFAHGPHPCLTFVVSGLSKVAALPQMKVAWLTVLGPDVVRRDALARLEVIADTFLSMNVPAQHALGAWLAGRGAIQEQIVKRVRENLVALTASSLPHLPVEAGWSVVLRCAPRFASETFAEEVLAASGVSLHPGRFYGFAACHWLVASLLAEPELFAAGTERLKQWCEP